MESGNPEDVLSVLAGALREWRATPASSALYPARAFCVHELVPSQLTPAGFPGPDPQVWRQPTSLMIEFRNIGIEYFYYSPDAAWTLREDPVDLDELAAKYWSSRWGREAFLMMTQMGWSHGACAEGPDQFREVIKHSEEFLKVYPQSEVSDRIRLELANAYATWWNVSQMEPDGYANPASYKPGAERARQRAIIST